MKLSVSVLGRVVVRMGDRTVEHFTTSKCRDLLVALVLQPGEWLGRDELVHRLWPEPGLSNDRNRLSVTFYLLKRDLAAAGIDADSFFESQRSQVRVIDEMVETDFSQFEIMLSESLKTSDSSERMSILAKAAELYRGPLHQESVEDWVMPLRAEASRMYQDTIMILAQYAKESGDRVLAREWLRKGIVREPYAVPALELLARWELDFGDPETAKELCFRIEDVMFRRGSQPSERLAAFLSQVRDEVKIREEDYPFANRPTTSFCVVDPLSVSALLSVAEARGLPLGVSPGSVAVRNPILAHRVARDVLRIRREARAIVTTLLQSPEEELPASVAATMRRIPDGTVFAMRGAAALIEQHVPHLVRERVTGKARYGLIVD